MDGSRRRKDCDWASSTPAVRMAEFSKLAKALTAEGHGPLSERYLSDRVKELHNFIEFAYGRDSPKPRDMVKIPFRFFRDTKVRGPCHVMLEAMLVFLKEKGRRELGLPTRFSTAPSLTPAATNLLMMGATKEEVNLVALRGCPAFFDGCALSKEIVKALTKAGLLSFPSIYFTDTVPASMTEELQRITESHGGRVVGSEAEATHLLQWDEEVDTLPMELVDDYVRPIELRPELSEGLAYVHWWYYPDSYDEWIPLSEVEGNEAPDSGFCSTSSTGKPLPLPPNSKWKVSCRFIKDCELFNEWGNEMDYIDEDDLDVSQPADEVLGNDDKKGRGGTTKKGKASKSKKVGEAKTDEYIPGTTTLFSRKVLSRLPRPSLDKSLATFNSLEVLGSGEHVYSYSRGSEVTENDKGHEGGDSNKGTVFAPTLDADTPDEEETQFVKDVFGSSNSDNIAVYLQTRNAILRLHKIDPNVYLKGSDCRAKIALEASLLTKVHSFLEERGIINSKASLLEVMPTLPYQPSVHNLPIIMAPSLGGASGEDAMQVEDSGFHWTPSVDLALLGVVTDAASAITTGEIDWTCISDTLSKSVGSRIPAGECVSRFAQVDLSCYNLQPPQVNLLGLLSRKLSRRLRSLANQVKLSCMPEIYQLYAEAAEVVEEATKESGENQDAETSALLLELDVLLEKSALMKTLHDEVVIEQSRLNTDKQTIFTRRSKTALLTYTTHEQT